jgi:DNA-binding NarL/FixJ family response regulator
MRTLSAGARGFVSKGQDPQDLFSAIEKVLAGGRAIDPSYIDLILSSVDSDNSQLPHERLSNREFDIMGRLASGESIQSIASSLCISPKTVSTYRRRCLEKMGFDRNSQLTEYVLTYLQLPKPAA